MFSLSIVGLRRIGSPELLAAALFCRWRSVSSLRYQFLSSPQSAFRQGTAGLTCLSSADTLSKCGGSDCLEIALLRMSFVSEESLTRGSLLRVLPFVLLKFCIRRREVALGVVSGVYTFDLRLSVGQWGERRSARFCLPSFILLSRFLPLWE